MVLNFQVRSPRGAETATVWLLKAPDFAQTRKFEYLPDSSRLWVYNCWIHQNRGGSEVKSWQFLRHGDYGLENLTPQRDCIKKMKNEILFSKFLFFQMFFDQIKKYFLKNLEFSWFSKFQIFLILWFFEKIFFVLIEKSWKN